MPDSPLEFTPDQCERIYRYLLSMLHDPAEAEDLTQETFLRAHRSHESLRDQGALTSWLYRIATHACLDRLRQRKAQPITFSDADLAEDDLPVAIPPSLQQVLEQKEMSRCVQQYIAGLSDSYRAVILLSDLRGLTALEIATLLGEPPGAVKIRLHRARVRLRRALEAACNFSRDGRNTLVCEPKS